MPSLISELLHPKPVIKCQFLSSYPDNGGGVERDGTEGSAGQSHREELRELQKQEGRALFEYLYRAPSSMHCLH